MSDSEYEYPENGLHTYDAEQICDEIVELFQECADWHGFRTTEEVEREFHEGRVLWSHRDGAVITAVNFRHCERKPYTRVYFTAMRDDYWDPEAWSNLIDLILDRSPWGRVVSKTVAGSEESRLWEDIADHVRREDGKERPLDVWKVEEMDFGAIEDW